MFVFFSWVHLEQSDSDMPLHMSIQYQGYYVWLVFNRSCFNYSDLCSDNRIYSRIKMMSGLSNFSKYIWKEENALFSRTKSKFTVLHLLSMTQFSGVALEKVHYLYCKF